MENNELVKDFSDLLDIGHVTKSITVGKHCIKLRTLSYDEQSGLIDAIPPEVKDFKRIDLLQKEMLATAIEDIDGVKLTKEQKKALLGNGQAAFCNFIFSEYEELVKEQTENIEDVKKNSSQLTKTILQLEFIQTKGF